MTPPRSEGFVRMPDAEFEAILTRAAEEGAKRALADGQAPCPDLPVPDRHIAAIAMNFK